MIEKIRKMREQGYSYSEIAKKVSKNKRFVWRKSHEVQFTKEGKERYQREVTGITKEIKSQEVNLLLRKTRVIGHVLFDGCLYKKTIDVLLNILIVQKN
jgi:intein-encoded DNA endonuclease-like protein